jgi:hypothetical protein
VHGTCLDDAKFQIPLKLPFLPGAERLMESIRSPLLRSGEITAASEYRIPIADAPRCA